MKQFSAKSDEKTTFLLSKKLKVKDYRDRGSCMPRRPYEGLKRCLSKTKVPQCGILSAEVPKSNVAQICVRVKTAVAGKWFPPRYDWISGLYF